MDVEKRRIAPRATGSEWPNRQPYGRTGGRITRPDHRGKTILIFLPFLIIDLVVAAILMSMGMMMVPPAIVSLPFKLAFFAVADGWTLISGALVRGYI